MTWTQNTTTAMPKRMLRVHNHGSESTPTRLRAVEVSMMIVTGRNQRTMRRSLRCSSSLFATFASISRAAFGEARRVPDRRSRGSGYRSIPMVSHYPRRLDSWIPGLGLGQTDTAIPVIRCLSGRPGVRRRESLFGTASNDVRVYDHLELERRLSWGRACVRLTRRIPRDRIHVLFSHNRLGALLVNDCMNGLDAWIHEDRAFGSQVKPFA